MMVGMPPSFNPAAGQQFSGFSNFGAHAMQAPGWSMSNPGMMMNGSDEGGHQTGPMRRGGGRINNVRTGPYDRRAQPRFNDGRLNPMIGVVGLPGMRRGGYAGAGGAGKWGDGAGAQTVGPKEAVQGRTLRKYDDLDAAVEGGAGGELNY